MTGNLQTNFQLSETADNYAVLGFPVSHSLSPKIHDLFAHQFDHDICYQAIEVIEEEFEAVVKRFFEQGGKGLNITLPFKERARMISDTCSSAAEMAGAANTLIADKDSIRADNTDGPGLVHDLKINHGIDLTGLDVLILGAGGAVRGVMQPLINEQITSISIANRTLSKAETLAGLFTQSCPVNAFAYTELEDKQFDLIINGTSASLKNELPPLAHSILKKDTCSYDMMYASEPTLFQIWSSNNGVKQAYDGLGMLVEQAAESYKLWHGVRPETATVLETLRKGQV